VTNTTHATEIDETLPSVSQSPVHLADRHLEEVQALLKLLTGTSEHSDDKDWLEARHGFQIVFRQMTQQLLNAREALDDA
jgi:hypothetical protein